MNIEKNSKIFNLSIQFEKDQNSLSELEKKNIELYDEVTFFEVLIQFI